MNIGIRNPRAAVLAIDCHRGHLDLSVATMPATQEVADMLVRNNKRLMDGSRALGVPVVHMVTRYRDRAEIEVNPFWRRLSEDPSSTRKNAMRHNLDGSPGCQIMPGLHQQGDVVVDTKKRYDCFLATDLDFALRARGVDTLLVTGINTNSCVLATAIAANVRDYAVVIVEDCVGTMDTPAHHEAALLCLRTAFAHVASTDEVLAAAATWQGREKAA